MKYYAALSDHGYWIRDNATEKTLCAYFWPITYDFCDAKIASGAYWIEINELTEGRLFDTYDFVEICSEIVH